MGWLGGAVRRWIELMGLLATVAGALAFAVTEHIAGAPVAVLGSRRRGPLTGLRFYVFGNRVGLRLDPGIHLGVERLHLLQRVVELGPEAHALPLEEMPGDKKDQPQTEQTPKGLTVPVAKRREFFANLKKVAEPGRLKKSPHPPPRRHQGR
jgi:hypothetical protein